MNGDNQQFDAIIQKYFAKFSLCVYTYYDSDRTF